MVMRGERVSDGAEKGVVCEGEQNMIGTITCSLKQGGSEEVEIINLGESAHHQSLF